MYHSTPHKDAASLDIELWFLLSAILFSVRKANFEIPFSGRRARTRTSLKCSNYFFKYLPCCLQLRDDVFITHPFIHNMGNKVLVLTAY